MSTRTAVNDRRTGLSDRRRGERLPFVAAVRKEPQVSLGFALPRLSQITNIGESGMLVLRCRAEGDPGLPAQTPMRLCFGLPDDAEPLELWAEVVFDRLQPGDGRYAATGLLFRDVPPEAARRLRALLQLP